MYQVDPKNWVEFIEGARTFNLVMRERLACTKAYIRTARAVIDDAESMLRQVKLPDQDERPTGT